MISTGLGKSAFRSSLKIIKEERNGRVSLRRKLSYFRCMSVGQIVSRGECRVTERAQCRCSYARVTTDFNANSFDEIIKHARRDSRLCCSGSGRLQHAVLYNFLQGNISRGM